MLEQIVEAMGLDPTQTFSILRYVNSSMKINGYPKGPSIRQTLLLQESPEKLAHQHSSTNSMGITYTHPQLEATP